MAANKIKLARYRSYDGKEYKVIGFAKHSETQEDVVIARELNKTLDLWGVPVTVWNSSVEYNGQEVPRYGLA